MQSITQFYNDVIAELKKVTWLSRTEAIKMTIIVIITTIGVGVYTGAIDYVLTALITRFIA